MATRSAPLPYSCLENPTDRGSWQVTVHGVAKSQKRVSMHARTHEAGLKAGRGLRTQYHLGLKKKNLHRLGASSNWQDQRIRAEPNQCATQRGWEESSG